MTWNDNAAFMGLHKSDSKYTNLCLEVNKASLTGISEESYNVKSAAKHVSITKLIGPLDKFADETLKEKMGLNFLVQRGFIR